MASAVDLIIEEVTSVVERPDELLRVVTAQVEPKHANVVLQYLSKQLPLMDHSLGHLKRMRKSRIVVEGSSEPLQVLEVALCSESTWASIGDDVMKNCPAPLHHMTTVEVS